MTENPNLTIVIPAYNESARIVATLQSVVECIRVRGWNAQVLVVNDGSTDDTAEIVARFQAGAPEVNLLENPGNRGKGYSVRAGMLHAQSDIVMFSDADLSAPIEEANTLFAAIEGGADIAIGSRWLQPETQTHRQSLLRQFYGRLFNLALRLLLGLNFKDTQCGFKAFTRSAALAIFPLQKIERWGFDPELLYLARRAGLKVKEVPVAWAHVEGTRLSPLRDGIRMFGEVLKIRWYALTGKYSKPNRLGQNIRSG